MRTIALLVPTLFVAIALAAPLSRVSVYRQSGTSDTLQVFPKLVQGFPTEWAKDELARATFHDTYDQKGWSHLYVASNPNPQEQDIDTSYAAGYAESYITVVRIEQHAKNSGVQNFNMSQSLRQFFDSNDQFIRSMAKLVPSMPKGKMDRQVFYQASLLDRQLEGAYHGYVAGRKVTDKSQLVFPSAITRDQFRVMTFGGDLEDLENLYQPHTTVSELRRRGQWDELRDVSPVFNRGRCSSIVRYLPDGEMFVSQVTWSSFNSMLRIWKAYNTPHKVEPNSSQTVPGAKQAFSSYPGVLFSGDDFYVLGSKLVVHETTIGNDNTQLASDFISPASILEWMRNMLANKLATSAPHWHSVYSRFNSGTYNNMNIVVDYNLLPHQTNVTIGKATSLPPNTVVISEQIPGHVRVTDITTIVEKDGYFGSYNMARDPFIAQINGQDESRQKSGDWFSYDGHPRAKIFNRDAPKTRTLEDVQRLMRSCDFTRDPFSSQMETCKHVGKTDCWPEYTSENCLATRGDLNPENGRWGISAFGLRNHVATDAKIATRRLVDQISSSIVSGPPGTVDNPHSTPDFVFSSSPFKSLPHLGIPDRVVFPWVEIPFEP